MFLFTTAEGVVRHHHMHIETENLLEYHFKLSNFCKGESLDKKSDTFLSKQFLRLLIINGAGIILILGGSKILSLAIFFPITKCRNSEHSSLSNDMIYISRDCNDCLLQLFFSNGCFG